MTASPRLSAGLLLAALLAAAWFARPGTNAPSASAAPPMTVASPYTHENLTVYVVRGPDEFDAGNVMTLQEALDRGLAVVHETGNVNMLAVENKSEDQDLFLQSGDIVKGGRQDRLIASDMIVPAKSGKVPCPANCCEHSRWSGRGQEAATHFARSTDFAVGNDIKIANATRQQGEVWANVAKAQEQLSEKVGKPVNAAASPTSLQLALEDKDLQAKLAGYEQTLARAAAYPDAIGVVVAVNGKVIAADVYGSAKLFQKVWPKLLKSAAADALAQLPKGEAPAPPPVAAAKEFLASAAGSSRAGEREPPLSDGTTNALRVLSNNEFNSSLIGNRVDVQVVGGTGEQGSFLIGGGVNQSPAPSQVVTTGVHPDASPAALPDPGVIVLHANPAAAQQLQQAGVGGFDGQSVTTQGQTLQAGGGNNLGRNAIPYINRIGGRGVNGGRANDPESSSAAAANAPGVVVVESQAPAKPGVTVHRSYLKK
jgi:hypothetical protein